MIRYDGKQQFSVEKDFLNRTKIYLYPAVVLMKSYRPYIRDLKESLLCVSYGGESIILYYDRNNTIKLKSLIDELKKNNEYIDSWLHNQNSIAIKISPDINYLAFEEGRYTDIYTREQIGKTFTPDSKTRKVLLRDASYKEEYVNQLNIWFNTSHTVESLETHNGKKQPIKQYDIPPCMNQEVLNYNEQHELPRVE